VTPELDDHRAAVRSRSFGQDGSLSVVDRLGRWLSERRVRRAVGPMAGRAAADLGCGFHADLARRLFASASSLVLVDVAVDPSLRDRSDTQVLEGLLPVVMQTVPSESLDVVLCNNVLEHVWEPELTLHEIHRVLRPGGIAVVNVPSWHGKRFLELAAFRFSLAPADEMDDHKMYYDPRDLWPLLVRVGFRPSRIDCRRHKALLNTIAVCRK
jgi:SAM-dependent methyltransferase